MSVRLVPVSRDNVNAALKLKVAADQDGFVAPNAVSLAQAAYESATYPFAIESDGVLVGFCQLIDLSEYAHREPEDDADGAYLWRFMIAADQQGKGFGAAALDEMIGWAKARGRTSFGTSAVPDNAGALALYERRGLMRTGRVVDGEIELRLVF